MKVEIWDTYVVRENGQQMHFDIVIEKSKAKADEVYSYGEKYLNSKSISFDKVSSNECQFCHIESATEAMIKSINKKGYYIIEMENCA